MKHSILFKNQDNHWDNALPLGNGVFGCMVYYENSQLHIPMNHYEVYYNISASVLPEDILKSLPEISNPGADRAERTRIANANAGEPFFYYKQVRNSAGESTNKAGPLCASTAPYAIKSYSGSYPATGNLTCKFRSDFTDADHQLVLYTEDAKVQLTLAKSSDNITVDTIVAREDCILTHITQSQEGLFTDITLDLNPYRDLDAPELKFTEIDSHTFTYTATRKLGEKTFAFAGILELIGAEGNLTSAQYACNIQITRADKDFHIITSVVTDFRCKDVLADGIAQSHKYAASLDNLYCTHKAYWDTFFSVDKLSLPDPFLEHIYCINQYALDCCSGEGGIMKHHACGLNGLWAVKHPNLWGSMWYWDVNIQAAFAGVFSSNRLHLAKVFSDGLRSYMKLARYYAKSVHNLGGLAIDYPYSFYHSCWPWCAQYLWNLYEYSLDEDYLRTEAYPLFLDLCQFVTEVFVYDAATDCYHIYPDISPEQGPLAHDTTITISSCKYLLQFTLKAAEILGDNPPILKICRKLLEKMPEYAFSTPDKYGVHLKDSPDAPDQLWLRHPSLLTPLFPIGEFDMNSPEEIKKIMSNTIDFLEDNCEIGIFGGSWLAAGAARLGRGQTALRLIYERGIDHMLRSNGLTAEQTDRFINDCLVYRQPLYYPCMMEFTGEMLAAVNEMLLQSHNGIIRIFPALPDGDRELDRLIRRGQSLDEYDDRYAVYAPWDTVRFDRLLAKGAFEISAQRQDGKLIWVQILSKKGRNIRISCPYFTETMQVYEEDKPIAFTYNNGVFTFETVAGKTYLIAHNPDAYTAPDTDSYNHKVLSHLSYTKRSIFLGEDINTPYQKALDSFLRSWYYGNIRMENHTVYKFDFGCAENKDYSKAVIPQANAAIGILRRALPFIPVSSLPFTVKQGYGFENSAIVTTVDRGAPDLLRRDFAEGTQEAVFCIEVPRGQYELLVVSGDAENESFSNVWVENGRSAPGKVLKKGHFQAKLLPLILEEDGHIRLHISTDPGYHWKLNCLFVNTLKGY